jgi:hypothetical protein
MKKNALLFALLVALLGVTYVFQERRVADEHREERLRDALITEEIRELKLPAGTAVRRDGQWRAGAQLLSHNLLKQIVARLSELRKVRAVSGDWKSFFPNPFTFGVNGTTWTIGDLTLDREGFYVARGREVFLAVIDGGSTELSTRPEDVEAAKLNALVRILSLPLEDLKERQLFRFFPKLPMDRAVIAVDGRPPFELDFVGNETLPPPVTGVAVHRDLRGKFHSLLTQVSLREEVPYSEALKFKKLGEIRFLKDKVELAWELWLRSAKTADALVIDPSEKRAFLMVGGTLKIFFVGVQDYWDKKVIPEKYFVSFARLDADFIQGARRARVSIANKEPLEFSARGHTVDPAKMELLVQFLFNLGPRDQAERVSNLSASERRQLLARDLLRVQVMDQELVIERRQQEVIVANVSQGFKAHFTLLDENFRGTFEDVLK